MHVVSQVSLAVMIGAAFLIGQFAAQKPSLADDVINKDRASRAALLAAGRWTPQPYQPGFFGTIFQLIKGQVNDTKSAYRQISTLINDQFSDDNEVPKGSDADNSTEVRKISRAEFLRILDRNLKGLRRLRDLEWREAKKDSLANLRAYKEEIQKGKSINGR